MVHATKHAVTMGATTKLYVGASAQNMEPRPNCAIIQGVPHSQERGASARNTEPSESSAVTRVAKMKLGVKGFVSSMEQWRRRSAHAATVDARSMRSGRAFAGVMGRRIL